MPDRLVLQSCPAGEACGWLADCMQSVRDWATARGIGYRWLDDELFAVLPEQFRPGGRITPVIASDLARLLWARAWLQEHPDGQLLWLDADVLVFRPAQLALPETDHAVGREHWVQPDGGGQWRCHRQVQNAALFFRADRAGRNVFLDFYAQSAERLLARNLGGMPPQFIGPKLLTALHNVVQFPVMEDIGMISPGLAAALLQGEGAALDAYQRRRPAPLAAANLCRSNVQQGALDEDHMRSLIDLLLRGAPV